MDKCHVSLSSGEPVLQPLGVAWVLEWKLRILVGYQEYHRRGHSGRKVHTLYVTAMQCTRARRSWTGVSHCTTRGGGEGSDKTVLASTKKDACSKQASLYSRHSRVGRGKEEMSSFEGLGGGHLPREQRLQEKKDARRGILYLRPLFVLLAAARPRRYRREAPARLEDRANAQHQLYDRGPPP